MAYSLRQRTIVHDYLDGEVVIVNFINGRYYSLRDVAAFVWNVLATGPSSIEDICERLVACYSVEPTTVTFDIEKLLHQMTSEKLISECDATEVTTTRINDHSQTKMPYTSPTIEIHTDMQEVIILDPVHELAFLKE